MQAVIDLALNVISALTLAVLAHLGVDTAPPTPPEAQRVVARSPQARAAPATARPAVDCPEGHPVAPTIA